MKYRTGHHIGKRANDVRSGGRTLIKVVLLVACALAPAALRASAPSGALVLEKTIVIPLVPVGPYSDYMSIDLAGKRLFATPQAASAVAVIDLRNGHVLKMLSGIGNPHGSYYSPTSKRLFVADGESGDVKVFNGLDYTLIKIIPLKKGADWMIYDPRSKFLYVNNGGEDAGMDHALITVLDPIRMKVAAEIPIATPGLEASVIDPDKQLLYVNLVEASAVAVVDLTKRRTMDIWKLPAGRHRNLAITLDPVRDRVYVACRDSPMHGSVVVLDSTSGRPVATLPIGGLADGIWLDKKRGRLYVSTGIGHIETYAIAPNDVYRRQPTVDSAVMAKTSLYSSELDRLYVSVPHVSTQAQILVFKPAPS